MTLRYILMLFRSNLYFRQPIDHSLINRKYILYTSSIELELIENRELWNLTCFKKLVIPLFFIPYMQTYISAYYSTTQQSCQETWLYTSKRRKIKPSLHQPVNSKCHSSSNDNVRWSEKAKKPQSYPNCCCGVETFKVVLGINQRA